MTSRHSAATPRTPIAARAVRASLGAVAAAIAAATPVRAQSACRPDAGTVSQRVAERQWPAPLDRAVTLQGDNLTLREGLARLASAARVRFSYVAELLPLDRPLCLAYRAVPAGQVLADFLRGTQLEPVVAGDDQVVLAPARRTALSAPDDGEPPPRRASTLDRVVVIGAPESESERATPISVAVVTREQLERQGSSSLQQILEGGVPGVWMWQSSPASLAARYGSVRGASSFGVSYPKIYIDGIEVANPLLVKEFDASTIERVEVIRGPQGAALYGADAISGVINIVTRHDGVAPGGQRLQLQSTAGVSGSKFAAQDVLTQQHRVTLRAGTSMRSAGLGLSMTTLGAYIPGAFARTIAGYGDFRIVGARTVLTGTARLFTEDAGTATSPLLPQLSTAGGIQSTQRIIRPSDRSGGSGGGAEGPHTAWSEADAEWPKPGPSSFGGSLFQTDTTRTQSVRQYTVGSTLAYTPNDRWTHAFTFGVDGYRLRNPTVVNGPIPSAVDSALGAARGGADRFTARVSSTARFGAPETASAALTFSAEHSAVRQQTPVVPTVLGPEPDEPVVQGDAVLTGWRSNMGLVTQATTSLRNRFFLTAGMRVEQIDALSGASQVAALPMVGGAIVGDHGDVTLKLRAAYGKAIRPVDGAIRDLALDGRRLTLIAYDLEPEQQSGVEAGVDLVVGRSLGLSVTRFDQRASGLIQSVAVTLPSQPPRESRWDGGPSGPTGPYVGYQLQNVGEIGNRGWEIEGNGDLGRLSLTGTVSLVDSRVRRLAAGYSGDLRAGDRVLDVPARTATLTAAWTGQRWFTSLSLGRATDWIGYDRLAVADSLTSGSLDPTGLVGSELRNYWREYSGVTRLRATFTRDLFHGLSFVMTGDNLLGQQRGEPDDVTVVPGRTITAGVKAKF